MQTLTGTLGALAAFNVKGDFFRADYMASLLFSVVAVLELLFLAEVNFSGMLCIPNSVTVDDMVDMMDSDNYPWENEYINLMCATEIRWGRKWFYFAKIAVLGLAFFILLGCRHYIYLINISSCVLSRQMLPELLQDTVIPPEVEKYEGFGIAYKQVKSYMIYKAWSAVLYGMVVLPTMLLQVMYEPWNNAIIPNANHCISAMSKFNPERHVDFRCHIDCEWEAFVLAAVSSFFNMAFFITYCASVFTTLKYLRRPENFLRKSVNHDLIPGHANDGPDLEGAIKAICRVAKQINPGEFDNLPQFDGITRAEGDEGNGGDHEEEDALFTPMPNPSIAPLSQFGDELAPPLQ